jgi:hypothetical protein
VEFAVICELEATSTSWKKGLGLTVAHPTATALWVIRPPLYMFCFSHRTLVLVSYIWALAVGPTASLIEGLLLIRV